MQNGQVVNENPIQCVLESLTYAFAYDYQHWSACLWYSLLRNQSAEKTNVTSEKKKDKTKMFQSQVAAATFCQYHFPRQQKFFRPGTPPWQKKISKKKIRVSHLSVSVVTPNKYIYVQLRFFIHKKNQKNYSNTTLTFLTFFFFFETLCVFSRNNSSLSSLWL